MRNSTASNDITQNDKAPAVSVVIQDTDKLADAFMALRNNAHQKCDEPVAELAYNLAAAHARLGELLSNYTPGAEDTKAQARILGFIWGSQFDDHHDFGVFDTFLRSEDAGTIIRTELFATIRHGLDIAMGDKQPSLRNEAIRPKGTLELAARFPKTINRYSIE